MLGINFVSYAFHMSVQPIVGFFCCIQSMVIEIFMLNIVPNYINWLKSVYNNHCPYYVLFIFHRIKVYYFIFKPKITLLIVQKFL